MKVPCVKPCCFYFQIGFFPTSKCLSIIPYSPNDWTFILLMFKNGILCSKIAFTKRQKQNRDNLTRSPQPRMHLWIGPSSIINSYSGITHRWLSVIDLWFIAWLEYTACKVGVATTAYLNTLKGAKHVHVPFLFLCLNWRQVESKLWTTLLAEGRVDHSRLGRN